MKDIIVITGGESGIGAELVKLYKERTADNNTQVLSLDIKTGFDVCNQESIERQIQKIEGDKYRIQLWINSAGVSGLGSFQKLSAAQFDQVLKVNLLAPIAISRALIPHMERNGFGQIVNLASVAGFVSAPMMSAYAASKAGLIGFHRSLALELKMKHSPIHMLLVCPGFVKTEMIQLGQEKGFPQWLSPLLSEAKDVARDIVKAVDHKKTELTPTFNGKLIKGLDKIIPGFAEKSSRALLARSLPDLLMNRLSLDD